MFERKESTMPPEKEPRKPTRSIESALTYFSAAEIDVVRYYGCENARRKCDMARLRSLSSCMSPQDKSKGLNF